MKILIKIVLVIVVLVCLLAAGVYFFLQNLDLNKYRDQITAQLSSRLGRQVRAGDMDVSMSLTQGFVLSLKDIGIADDPAFSQEEVFTVRKVFLEADILTLIQERRLVVNTVELIDPVLNVVMDNRGGNNLQALAAAAGAPAGDSGGPAPGGASPPAADAGQALSVSVREASLKNGRVVLTDRSKSRPSVLTLNGVEVLLQNVALNKEFPFEVDLGVFSQQDNVHVAGRVLVDAAGPRVTVRGLDLSTDLSLISLQSLNEFNPQIAEKFRTGLRGNVTTSDGEVALGPGGVESIALDIEVSGGRLGLTDVPFDLDKVNGRVSVRPDVIKVPSLSVQLAEGTVTVKGDVRDYLAVPRYDLQITTDGVQLEDLSALQDSQVKVAGALQSTIDIVGAGLTPEEARKNIQLNGGMEVKDGKLKDMNVLRIIFSKMSMIPNLVETIEANLPEKYRDELTRNDTLFNNLSMKMNSDSGGAGILLNRINVTAESFSYLAGGRMDLDGNLVMEGQVVIPADLSAAMVKGVAELKGIENSQGELVIPLRRYSGPAEQFRPFPDLAYLSKRIIVNRGRQELDKVLDKVFKTDEQTPAQTPEGTDGQPTDQTQQPQQEKPIERQLIDGVLDAILK